MSIARRITKNITVLLISRVIAKGIAFFASIYKARYLDPQALGILSYAASFTILLGFLTSLRFPKVLLRDVAKERKKINKYIGNLLTIQFLLSFLTLLVYLTVTWIITNSNLVFKITFLYIGSRILSSFATTFSANFKAFEQMEFPALWILISSVLNTSGVIVGIVQNYCILWFAFLPFLTSFAQLLFYSLLFIWKYNFTLPKINISFWKYLSTESIFFALTGVIGLIFNKITPILLYHFKGGETVGYYSIALVLTSSLSLLRASVRMALLPTMSKLSSSSKEKLNLTLRKSFKYLLLSSLPLGLMTPFLAEPFVILLYGMAYVPSARILVVLIWMVIANLISSPFWLLLPAVGKQELNTKIIAASLPFQLIIAFFLIPKLAGIGAAISRIGGQSLVFVLLLYFSLKRGYNLPKTTILNCLRGLFFGLILYGITKVLICYVPLFFALLLGGSTYLSLTYFFCFDEEDKKLFMHLLPPY